MFQGSSGGAQGAPRSLNGLNNVAILSWRYQITNSYCEREWDPVLTSLYHLTTLSGTCCGRNVPQVTFCYPGGFSGVDLGSDLACGTQKGVEKISDIEIFAEIWVDYLGA